MKFKVLIVALGIIAFSCGSIKKRDNYSSSMNNISMFSGFSILKTPRENISIGSQWIEGTGPLDSGLPDSILYTAKSLGAYDFKVDNKFNSEISLNLIHLLDANIDFEKSKMYTVNIKDAQVVRIADLNALNYSSNKTYIYEGIKVKSFELSSSKENIEAISGNSNKIIKGADISASEGNTNSKVLTVSGLNLFLAYRLISFGEVTSTIYGRQKTETKKRGKNTITTFYKNKNDIVVKHLPIELKTVNNPDGSLVYNDKGGVVTEAITKQQFSGFSINSDYEGKVFTLKDYLRTFSEVERKSMIKGNLPDSGKLVLIITCYNYIYSGKPKLIRVYLNCFNYEPEEYKILLDTRIIKDNYVIDELNLRLPKYEIFENGVEPFPIDQTNKAVRMEFKYKITQIPIKSILSTTTPGWN